MDPQKALRSLAGNERILIVDDDTDIVRFLEVNLRCAGYEVHVAYDGEEGLEKIRALMPDLVTTDVMMPRIDGIELVSRVRHDPDPDTADTPIIIIDPGSPGRTERALAAGADDFILKPFDPIEVLARVRGTLRRYAEGKTERPFYGRGDVSAEEVARYLAERAFVDNLAAGRSVGGAMYLEGVPLEEADREMRVAGKGEAALARLLRRRFNGTEGS